MYDLVLTNINYFSVSVPNFPDKYHLPFLLDFKLTTIDQVCTNARPQVAVTPKFLHIFLMVLYICMFGCICENNEYFISWQYYHNITSICDTYIYKYIYSGAWFLEVAPEFIRNLCRPAIDCPHMFSALHRNYVWGGYLLLCYLYCHCIVSEALNWAIPFVKYRNSPFQHWFSDSLKY